MSVSISDNYRANFLDMNLAWYHNGSRIVASGRRKMNSNDTSLTIYDAVDSDAGQYEVKIDSMIFTRSNSMECDGNFLPLLETMALHAPATFLLQQNTVPVYKPEGIIENYIIPPYNGEDQKTITISKTIVVENSTVFKSTWYGGYEIRKGNSFYISHMHVTFNKENITLTRRISYNDSRDVIGDYAVLFSFGYYPYANAHCPGYSSYLRYFSSIISLVYHYWTIVTKCKFKKFVII